MRQAATHRWTLPRVLLGMLLLGRLATVPAAAAKPVPLTDPALRAEQSESEGSLAGLAQAALLWRAVGQQDRTGKAIASFVQKLRTLSNASLDDRAAIAMLLEQVLDESVWTDTEAWRNHMQALLPAAQHAKLPDLVLRTQVRLAAWLWRQSCPIGGDDEACIRRLDATTHCRQARESLADSLRKQHRVSLMVWRPDMPSYSYEVIARDPSLSRQAQQLLSQALTSAKRAKLRPTTSGDPIDEALAHAKFLQAEPQFERALTKQRWKGAPSTIDPSFSVGAGETIVRKFQQDISAWMPTRLTLSTSPHQPLLLDSSKHVIRELSGYQPVLAHATARWSVAAHARLGQLYLDMQDQLIGCDGPAIIHLDSSKGSGVNWTGHAELDTACGYLFQEQAQTALHDCAEAASANLLQSTFSRFCVEAREKTATVYEKVGRYGLFSPHQRITLPRGTEPEIQPRNSPLPWSRIGL